MNNVELWTKALEIITNEQERIEVSKLIGEIVDASIPREAVQAAVDEIKEVYDIQCENEPAEDYNEGMDAALRTIKHHTGITPTVTP